MPAVRIKARRSYSSGSKRADGELYVSRISGNRLYVGWDAPKSMGITLEVSDAEAIKLLEFLQSLYSCEVCGVTGSDLDKVVHRDELCYK